MNFVYPALYKLDPAKDDWGREDPATGFVSKPTFEFLTEAALDLGFVYLLAGWRGYGSGAGLTHRLLLVVSNQVPMEVLQSLFGVQSVTDEAMADRLMLQREGDELCERVNTLVGELQTQLGCYLQVGVESESESSLPW